MQIVIIRQCLHLIVANTILLDLADGECILSAALMDSEGFTIERTSTEFRPMDMTEILDLSPDSKLVTVVGILSVECFTACRMMIGTKFAVANP